MHDSKVIHLLPFFFFFFFFTVELTLAFIIDLVLILAKELKGYTLGGIQRDHSQQLIANISSWWIIEDLLLTIHS